MRKRVKTGSPSSDGPQSQTMTRFSTSLAPHSPTPRRASPSSFTFPPASPPSPLALQPSKSLTIRPELSTATPTGLSPASTVHSVYSSLTSTSTASSSSVRGLLSRLSGKREVPQWVASTPKGADALRFRHFCPICYRHFTSILATSCCAHNICHECATSYLQSKLPNYQPLARLPADLMPCACPTCNQHAGVRFITVANTSNGRSYVESPRTAALVRLHEQHEVEVEVEEMHKQHSNEHTEGRAQLQDESERAQRAMAVVG